MFFGATFQPGIQLNMVFSKVFSEAYHLHDPAVTLSLPVDWCCFIRITAGSFNCNFLSNYFLFTFLSFQA